MKKLFLFDFDGTIADTYDVFLAELQHELRVHKKPPLTNLAYLRTLPARAVFKEVGFHVWQIPFLIRRIKPRIASLLKHCKPFPGMKATLAALAKQGEVRILTSNDTAAVEEFLSRASIIVHAVEGNVGIFGKAPVMRAAAKQAGVPLADTIYVGDEFRDLEAARSAGIRCALVSWGYNDPKALIQAKPDWLVKSPKELEKLSR